MSAPTPLFAPANARASVAADEVLASLPLSYVAVDHAAGSVVVLEGGGGWVQAAAAALDTDARAVIVAHPSPATVGPLLTRKALIVLGRRWAANPAIEPARAAFSAALPHANRLECQVRLPTGVWTAPALLDQVGLVRALAGPVTRLRLVSSSAHGYAAEGVAAGHAVDLSLICTDAVPDAAYVRLLTEDGAVELRLPSEHTAGPALLTITDTSGSTLSPTSYESGHRATWRRMRTLLSTGAVPPTDLQDFVSDWETVRTALKHVEG